MPKIVLPPYCDRGATLALYPEFVEQAGSGHLTIDGTACERAGQLILQLLLAARRTTAGATIKPSAALQQAADLAGIAKDLFENNGASDDE